jgi:hypothetical protein
MRANRVLCLVDSMQRVCFGRNSVAILAAPFEADRYAPPVQSSILAAKAERTLGKKSLFDAVPLLAPF